MVYWVKIINKLVPIKMLIEEKGKQIEGSLSIQVDAKV